MVIFIPFFESDLFKKPCIPAEIYIALPKLIQYIRYEKNNIICLYTCRSFVFV